jgi:Kef-type K+ transport system membrane component KefB
MHADPQIWFQLTLLLVISVLSHFVISRLRQPMVVGEIIIGMLIGPSVIGFTLINVDLVSGFAQLGAIVLLFMIGLECDLKTIYTKRNFAIAIGGVILPWVSGFLAFSILLPEAGTITAIFVGASLVATSVAVTASVLLELNLISKPVGTAILGAAVVDDILGMLVLAIAGGAAGDGVDLLNVLYLVVAALGFVIIGVWAGSRYLCRILQMADREGKERGLEHTGFVLAFTIALFYAYIAEVIGISAIVGAFVAGTLFSKLRIKEEFERGTKYLGAIFAPVFFVSLGILFDVSSLAEYLWVAIAITVVAVLSKVVGCGIPAHYSGMSWRDSIAVGIGMSPRLEVALIIALYGLSTGIIEEEIYSIVVFMGLVTALITPPLFRLLFRGNSRQGMKAISIWSSPHLRQARFPDRKRPR